MVLRFDFNYDNDYYNPLHTTLKNHSSASMFREHVKACLQEEMDFGAIIGPYEHPPIEGLHVSLFLSRATSWSSNKELLLILNDVYIKKGDPPHQLKHLIAQITGD